MSVNLKKIENNYNVIRWVVFGVLTLLGVVMSYLKVVNIDSKTYTLLALACYLLANMCLIKPLENLIDIVDYEFEFGIAVIVSCVIFTIEFLLTYIIASNGFTVELTDKVIFLYVISCSAIVEWVTFILILFYRRIS